MTGVNAYPLQWPEGWPRTKSARSSNFATSMADARDSLLHELRLLRARNVVISANLLLRQDGLPRANQPEPMDRGIAVYFELKGQQRCIPCDKWARVQDNMQAIRLTVAALRGLERWGAKQMVDAAFSGFRALPSDAWWDRLGVDRNATRDQVTDAFRALVKIHHPDRGGDPEQFVKIKGAYDAAMREIRA